LFRKGQVDRELDEEPRAYQEMAAEEKTKPVSAGTYADISVPKQLFEDVAAGADHQDDLTDPG
jgi:hypothetical protein